MPYTPIVSSCSTVKLALPERSTLLKLATSVYESPEHLPGSCIKGAARFSCQAISFSGSCVYSELTADIAAAIMASTKILSTVLCALVLAASFSGIAAQCEH